MDMRQALHTRRTIHRYTSDEVPRAAVERALDAAHQAPSHRHTWPWRFTVVGRETRGALADLAIRLKTRAAPLADDIVARIRAKIMNPAWVIIVRRIKHPDAFTAREDYASIACAIQNMHLSLWAEGIGSKWSSGAVTTHPDTYKALGIDDAIEHIEGFVWVGMAQDEHKPPPRPALADFVTWLP